MRFSVHALGDTPLIGGILVSAGQPTTSTRAKLGGATPGTSPASRYFRRRFPQRLPRRVLLPTGTLKTGFKISGTATYGGAFGRLVPLIGWGILIWDVVELGIDLENGDVDLNDETLPYWMFPAQVTMPDGKMTRM